MGECWWIHKHTENTANNVVHRKKNKKRASEKGEGIMRRKRVITMPVGGGHPWCREGFYNHMNKRKRRGQKEKSWRESLRIEGIFFFFFYRKNTPQASSSIQGFVFIRPSDTPAHLSLSCSSCCWPQRCSSLCCPEWRSEHNRLQNSCLQKRTKGIHCRSKTIYARLPTFICVNV